MLPTPNRIAHDVTTGREISLLTLDGMQTSFGWRENGGQKFACFCAMDASGVPTEELSTFCARLIGLGCGYFCAWGPDCERLHDIMDAEVIGDNPPETDLGCLMTTWHARESLGEAVNFFLTCTVPDAGYAPNGCAYGVAIAVACAAWAAEIEEHILAATATA
ncbi:MAG TPA: hypothetical protein VHW09_23040 [Bryobacteraceae bacterium]|jgi:hypothetical protein|nr:hypothetical protein [Bryobacteraceae bacterium]